MLSAFPAGGPLSCLFLAWAGGLLAVHCLFRNKGGVGATAPGEGEPPSSATIRQLSSFLGAVRRTQPWDPAGPGTRLHRPGTQRLVWPPNQHSWAPGRRVEKFRVTPSPRHNMALREPPRPGVGGIHLNPKLMGPSLWEGTQTLA